MPTIPRHANIAEYSDYPWYILYSQTEDMQQQIIKETFQLVSKRDENVCNFLEGGR